MALIRGSTAQPPHTHTALLRAKLNAHTFTLCLSAKKILFCKRGKVYSLTHTGTQRAAPRLLLPHHKRHKGVYTPPRRSGSGPRAVVARRRSDRDRPCRIGCRSSTTTRPLLQPQLQNRPLCSSRKLLQQWPHRRLCNRLQLKQPPHKLKQLHRHPSRETCCQQSRKLLRHSRS